MDKLIFAQLTKVDEEKRLVYGRAVQETPDRVGEIFDYETSKPMFEAWSKSQSDASMGKSFGNVRAMHKDVSAGIVVPGGMVFHDDERAIDLCAKISDDNEWRKVLDGVYTGFSIGGRYAKKWEDAELKKTRYTADPSEVSLVDRPCVPTATFFEIQKADGSVMQKNFAEPPTRAQMVDAMIEAFGGDSIAKFSDEEVAKRYTELMDKRAADATEAERVAKAARETLLAKAIEQGNDATAVAALSDVDLAALVEKSAPVEVTGTDEEVMQFAKLLNERGMTMGDAIKKIAERDDASAKEGKAKYGSVKFADEKNKKYPIDTEEHIRAAWNYISKDKNAGKYSPEDVKTIKAAIVAAWKDKIDKEGPPSAADDSKKSQIIGSLMKADGKSLDAVKAREEVAPYLVKAETILLRKGLIHCSDLAYVIQSLVNLTERVEYEAAVEDDGSELPARLTNAIADLGAILLDMVQEEIDEEVNGDEADELAHAPEQSETMMAMAEATRGLIKRLEPLRKAQDFQAMHDAAVKGGAKCAKAAKADGAATVDEALAKSYKESNDALAKSLSDTQETLAKALKDIETLKAQPLPSKARLMVVTKGQDLGSPEGATEPQIEPVLKRDGTVDEAATALKKIHATGGQPVRLR